MTPAPALTEAEVLAAVRRRWWRGGMVPLIAAPMSIAWIGGLRLTEKHLDRLHVVLFSMILVGGLLVLLGLVPALVQQRRAGRRASAAFPLTLLPAAQGTDPHLRDEQGRVWRVQRLARTAFPGSSVWSTSLDPGRPCHLVVAQPGGRVVVTYLVGGMARLA